MSAIEFLRDGLRDVMNAKTLEQARRIAREALRNFERSPTLDDFTDRLAGFEPPPLPEPPLPDPSWPGYTGGSRPSDPDTSKDAVVGNFPKSGTQRRRCLSAVAHAGGRGATASEVETATKLPVTSVAKRLGELERGGWIKRDIEANGQPRTRESSRGSESSVYVLTDAAEARRRG